MKKVSKVLLSLGITAALSATALHAKPLSKHHEMEDINANVVKVVSDAEKGIKVMVKSAGEKNKYEFTADELKDDSVIEAKLAMLDETSKAKVKELLAKLDDHKEKFVMIKDADISVDDKETQVYVVRSGNKENEMHVEIDVTGDGASFENKRLMKFALGEGRHGGKPHKMKKHHMKYHMEGDDSERAQWLHGEGKRNRGDWKQGERKHAAKIIQRMIEKSELSAEEITAIREALDAK